MDAADNDYHIWATYPRIVRPMVSTTDIDVFWSLMDDLLDDYHEGGGGFRYSRHTILSAFIDGRCLMQEIVNTSGEHHHDITLYQQTWHLLVIPSMCVVDDENNVILLWTRSDWRRCGIGKRYIEHVQPLAISNVLPSAVKFWQAMNISIINIIGSPM